MIVVTDQSTAEEVAEAITRVNALAKLSPRALGTGDEPSLWDRRHQLLDEMLTDWQSRTPVP